MILQQKQLSWGNFLVAIFLAAYTFTFMEWLFIITKPSFMDAITLGNKVEILLFTSALITILCYVAALPIIIISVLPWFRKYHDQIIWLSTILPAAIFASLGLLLVDNFLYTVFKFGIVTAQGVMRGVYGLVFLFLLVVFFRWIVKLLKNPPRLLIHEKSRKIIFAIIITTILVSLSIVVLNDENLSQAAGLTSDQNAVNQPHILLITSDGVNANHMSVYGYERDTTPEIRQMAEASLVVENAYTNSGNTAGSIISLYTGKYPTTTRVLYPPDILRGTDSYQHLPGILRLLGYHTVQITAPYFVDAYTFNVLDGFETANKRSATVSSYLPIINSYLPNDYAYFIFDTANRLYDRLRHIFYLKRMDNPYEMVTKPEALDDQQRLGQLLNEIRRADAPLFVHVHFLGTHGAYFKPAERVFSTEQSKKVMWDQDGYDDSILEFDKNMGAILRLLEKRNLLDKTIIVIGSDHGQQYMSTVRIPLIFRFPNGQFSGRFESNAQNLDIAPTLLAYLGVPQPEWIQGRSLLRAPSEQRPIFGFAARYLEKGEKDGTFAVNTDKAEPPFYQFGYASVIYCQEWYELNLEDLTLASGEIEGHTNPCPEDELLDEEQAINILIDQFQTSGFDTSSLNTLITEKTANP
jgi:arylsulfatase A-like enzyme